MATLLSYIIFGLSICSLVFGIIILLNNKKEKLNQYFFMTALGSTIWGLGFGLLLIQTTQKAALLCRAFGMSGVVLVIIFATKLFTLIAETPKTFGKIIRVVSYAGVFLYPFLIMPERATFYVGKFGMSYTFANDIWNTLYNVYDVVFMLFCAVVVILMRKKTQYKRDKILYYSLCAFIILLFSGTIFDTVLPMLGKPAFPGSTLAQFGSTMIAFVALLYRQKNTLSLQTISDHIYHSVDMPIFVIDTEANLKFLSDSGYKFFNIEKDKQINVLEMFSFNTIDEIINLSTKKELKECTINDKYLSISVEKVTDIFKDVIGYIILVTDLTEKNKYITELQLAKDEAEEASKSKDNFLANMSHELRTPLNAIIGMNNLLTNETDQTRIKEYTQQVDKSSKALLNMIDELFDFTKIQNGKLDIVDEEYNIVDTIKSIINTYKEQIEYKHLLYEVNVDKSIPLVLSGDEKRIKQCIISLLKNAIKYTNTGKITINVRATNTVFNSVLVIEVKDTGIGIDEENSQKLFSTFKGLEDTNNRNYEGIGMGLVIVKKLMILMNGSLDIKSELNKGTTCTLTLGQNIVNQAECGGFHEKNSTHRLAVIDDGSNDTKILIKLLQRELVELDIITNIDYNTINKKLYDYLFINYDEVNNKEELEQNLKEQKIVYISEENINTNNHKILKPVSRVKLKELLNLREQTKNVHCPKAKMLAVDDNKLNLIVLKGFLKNTGAQIETCTSGQEALELTAQNKYDIIFLDHMMPGMDGVETLKNIKAQNNENANIPAIVVTANAVEGAKDYYISQGFQEYISKPIDSEFLNETIRKYLPEELIEDNN